MSIVKPEVIMSRGALGNSGSGVIEYSDGTGGVGEISVDGIRVVRDDEHERGRPVESGGRSPAPHCLDFKAGLFDPCRPEWPSFSSRACEPRVLPRMILKRTSRLKVAASERRRGRHRLACYTAGWPISTAWCGRRRTEK